MAIDIDALTNKVVSHAMASGHFERVNAEEPTNAPGTGLTAAAWVQDIQPVRSSGLDSVSMLMIYAVRLYLPVNPIAPDSLDPAMVKALDALFAAYVGDFTFDGTIRSIDIFGANGTTLSGRAGYLAIDATTYRVYTITLPLVVNDVWDEEA